MIRQLEVAGAPAEVIAAARQQSSQVDGDIEVWPENEQSVKLFLSLGTQWMVAVGVSAMRPLGLNYQSMESAMRVLNIPRKDRPALFSDVRLMEREVLKVLNKQDD